MSRGVPADYQILKRRQQEDARSVYVNHGKEQHKIGAIATWELKTDAALGNARVQARYQQIRAMDAAALEERRRRLAEMLADERAFFEQALDSLQETPEQRKARMVSR